MTPMFCASEGHAPILRVHGSASVPRPHDAGWAEAVAAFPAHAGGRNLLDLSIELVRTSCGTGVPLMPFERPRAEDELLPFFEGMGPEGVGDHWRRKNAASLDGRPTGLVPEG